MAGPKGGTSVRSALGGDVHVLLNAQELSDVLHSEKGPVFRDLLRRGDRVKERAQQLAGFKTGNLRNHIIKRTARDSSGNPQVLVGIFSGVPYAEFHHEGTQPHVIRPRKAKVLRFESGGMVVFSAYVNHPGTKPNRFLTNALDAAR